MVVRPVDAFDSVNTNNTHSEGGRGCLDYQRSRHMYPYLACLLTLSTVKPAILVGGLGAQRDGKTGQSGRISHTTVEKASFRLRCSKATHSIAGHLLRGVEWCDQARSTTWEITFQSRALPLSGLRTIEELKR